MPFVLKKYPAVIGEKIQIHMVKNLGIHTSIAQKSIARGRVFDENNIPFTYGKIIKSDTIFMAEFEGQTRGLNPMFQTNDFAIFDKPTKLMVHPISKNTSYSLLDEVRFHFGENANLVHRIDMETSGLIMCAKNKETETQLKTMFEEKKYKKSYLAIVRGEIKRSLTIDSSIERENGMIGVRMKAGETGKESKTIINPIEYNKNKDLTLIEAIPITGRQHQIRVHLYSIGHTIYGDPIYNVDDKIADSYLNKTLDHEKRVEVTGSNRLWLHANYLEFTYKDELYKLNSQNKDIYKEFNS